jgi:hypothetical protein
VLFSLPALLAIAVDRIQLTRMPSQLVLLTLLFLTASVCFVFYVFSSSEVGGPQISFANPQICGLKNLLYLQTFRQCGDLRFCALRTQYFLRFADPIFADLSPQILYFFPYKIYT